MKISGILTINDSIYLGYPFLEAILSVLPITDEFLINDGGSKDKTSFYLRKLKRTFPKKIRLFNKPHYAGYNWEALDKCIEFLIDKAKGNWIIRVHADEIWYEKDLLKIKKTIEKAHKKGYNSLRTIQLPAHFRTVNQTYIYRNIVIFRKIKELKVCNRGADDFRLIDRLDKIAEGFTTSNVPPEFLTNFICLNLYDTVFPGNTLRKLKAHFTFLARGAEHRRVRWENFKKNPPPLYPPDPEAVKRLPALIQGLAGLNKYKVREELFDKKWLRKLTGLNYV